MKNLYIKNMVCNRCILVVGQELEKLGLDAERITLGEVLLKSEPSANQLTSLDLALVKLGFERIDDRKARLIEAIKKLVIEEIHHQEKRARKLNWSAWLADQLHYDYSYLSSLFSAVEGITLEQYIIHQKIERVKELLFYNELTLSQIADRMDYSSVAHLSAQFKKVTGMTPSELKKLRPADASRKPLDSVA
ncbi:MAG: helix-turn-helix transcriptional regulator [Cyclobacteriaceae bacterium]|nr:helix-turn-helix transcriptional regulator [Cyclobacteriaceae bacterium]